MKDNVDDMTRKGRRNDIGPYGTKSCTAKFTDEQIYKIRENKSSHWSVCKELALEYNVHPETIWSILKRKTWKHLHDPE